MSEAIVIRVDIPGRAPTPNEGGRHVNHWDAAKDIATWRNTARLLGLQARPSGWVPLARCSIEVEFQYPTKARRDPDNLIASTKPLTDGLVDAGLIKDDSLQVIEVMRFTWRHTPGYTGQTYTIIGVQDVTLGLA